MSKAFIQTASFKTVMFAKGFEILFLPPSWERHPLLPFTFPCQCNKFKAEISLKPNHLGEAFSHAFPHCHQKKAQPCSRPSETWGCSEQEVTALEWSPWDGWSPPEEQWHYQAHGRQKVGDHALWDCRQDGMVHCGPTCCSMLLPARMSMWSASSSPPQINREKTYLPRQG